MNRTDSHRPSAIVPADYEFVAHECVRIEGVADCIFVSQARAAIAAHFSKTGGTYSTHEHGGNCHVCGSVNAVYTILFYHSKTNTYVRLGQDCSAKLFNNDFGAKFFRNAVADVREHHAGIQKAQALLADYGLTAAWDVSVSAKAQRAECQAQFDIDGITRRSPIAYEAVVIEDMVGKLVKYGSISEKQRNYIAVLLSKLTNRVQVETKQAEEKELAADCPTGTLVVEGTVLTTKLQSSPYGDTLKMLVKHASGYKVWGSVPSGLYIDKGDIVRFTATIECSKDDKKFGFFKRPRKAVKLAVWGTPEFTMTAAA